jgi:hypothetical protein
LRIHAQLDKVLRKRLKEGLILQVILPIASHPTLQHDRKSAGGDLLLFVSLDALQEMLLLLQREFIFEISQAMHEYIGL